jgi:hypothetical protein
MLTINQLRQVAARSGARDIANVEIDVLLTYREIAAALFNASRLPERGWKTHDLRDRTIRLCRLGIQLMQGGYRQLLLHPYRHRLF